MPSPRLRLGALHQGGDADLAALADLIAAALRTRPAPGVIGGDRVVPRVVFRSPVIGEVALFPLFAEFGTIEDITVHDLRLELFFPADPESADRLHAASEEGQA